MKNTQNAPMIALAGNATLGARLTSARKAAGFRKATDATRHFNWVYSTYAGHESDARPYGREWAEIYGRAYQISPDFLLNGAADLQNGNFNPTSLSAGHRLEIFTGVRQIPVLRVSDLASFEDMIKGKPPRAERTEPLPSQIKAGPNAFAVPIEDDAMAGGKPSLSPGDICYFDPEADYSTGKIVAARVAGYPSIVLRKFRLLVGVGGQPQFDLTPANPDFLTFSSANHEINLLGRLIGIWQAC